MRVVRVVHVVRVRLLLACALSALFAGACAEVGGGPETPAAIEFPPFPSPSIVVGDTLRDINGVIAPVQAIVRNINGDIIPDVPVTYVYADFARDSALVVDQTTGIVRAVRAASGEARIAARVGNALQVIRTIVVTTRPDSLDTATPVTALLTTTFPDTLRPSLTPNKSAPLSVTLRHFEGTVASGVNAYVVQFELVSPVNAGNDTTAAVFIVNDNGQASAIDTTDATGGASRRVRVRAAGFPVGTAVDTVVVLARAAYRGMPVRGSPVRFAVPVARGTP